GYGHPRWTPTRPREAVGGDSPVSPLRAESPDAESWTRLRFRDLPDLRLGHVWSEDLSNRRLENLVTAVAEPGNRRARLDVGHDPDALGRLLVGVEDAHPANAALEA